MGFVNLEHLFTFEVIIFICVHVINITKKHRNA